MVGCHDIKISGVQSQAKLLRLQAGSISVTKYKAAAPVGRSFREGGNSRTPRSGLLRVGLKRKDLAAIRANPGDVIAGHPPEIFIHAGLADLESARTAPAETIYLSAANAILCRQRFFVPAL